MIYKFKSQAAGDLIMMGPAGDQVLRLIGKAPAATGIIAVDAMPAAWAALEQAMASEEAAPEAAGADPEAAAESGGHASVTLRQRAWPMVEMMKRCHAEKADIVWGV